MQKYRVHALVAAAYLGTFLATLDISIVNVALPTLQSALHADLAGLQWVVNIYAIALSAVMLSAGPLGDRYGHKRVWLGSVLLFVIGSLACAAAGRLETLLWGRAIQGVAGALLIPGAMPILTHAFTEPHQRARAIGGWSAFSALALISGPLAGGLLVEHFGWESVFLVNVPFGIVAFMLGAWGIPERKHPELAAFDPAGQVLSMLWLGMLSYGLIKIGEQGALSDDVLVSLSIALAGFCAFIWVERRVRRSLLPVRLFRNRSLALANTASFVLGFSSYSSLFFLSLFLQQAQGYSPAQTGWQMMSEFSVMAVASLMFGRLAARFSLQLLMVAGYTCVGVALCVMVSFTPFTSFGVIAVTFALLGLGTGLSVPATGMMVMGGAPPESAGIASATMNALRQTGMTMGIALLGSIMSIHAVHTLTVAGKVAGLADAAEMAERAVTDNIFPVHTDRLAEHYGSLYQSAMADSFGFVMFCAGILCLLVSGLLLCFAGDRTTLAPEVISANRQ
ncbi:MFS transporter [Photobacterium sp. CCB-ST2H9]|uniref:DHA2 family efflux MFS transporter permease subunit n=1 Tax=Photobacterium sp. CCB-ST2H9 TaxID=2912855 RepID=UPI002004B01C|nr:DHA2 family efflux MFS transporter permease subunit [Photobacterium sp. CCB-ST2H9]UTM56619.1 MFS transporter [Photobacterium sp. CCB-ST2H9]